MGKPLLDQCLEGYNCCLFAYGQVWVCSGLSPLAHQWQTGSGKSYSMMGYKEAEGVIPRFSNELFERIDMMSKESSVS